MFNLDSFNLLKEKKKKLEFVLFIASKFLNIYGF